MTQTAQMTLKYPIDLPLLLKTSRAEFETKVRFLAAAKLYELGEISSGKAAQMAELPRAEFLSKLGQYGIPAVNLSGDEIQAEIEAAVGRADAESGQP